MSNLRNAVLFALAFDATDEEIAKCVENINRFYERTGVDPAEIAAHTGPDQTVLQLSASVSADGLDSAGIPYDERIHASSKTKNADGTWRAKRGVDKAFADKIAADLKAVVAAPAPELLTAALPLPTLAAAPALPALPLPAPVNTPFTDFIKMLAANTRTDENPAGRLTDDWVKQVLVAYNVPDGLVQNLAHNPELLAGVSNYIKLQLG